MDLQRAHHDRLSWSALSLLTFNFLRFESAGKLGGSLRTRSQHPLIKPYAFNRAANFACAFATFGATTYWQ